LSMLSIMLFVIFDRGSEYLMPYVNAITSVFAVIIMIAFAFRILRWYKYSDRRGLILLYFLTALSIAIMIATDYSVKFMVATSVEVSAPGV
jgi:flagellin-like protein